MLVEIRKECWEILNVVGGLKFNWRWWGERVDFVENCIRNVEEKFEKFFLNLEGNV